MKRIIVASEEPQEDVLDDVYSYLHQAMNNTNDYLYKNGYRRIDDNTVFDIVEYAFNAIQDELEKR